MAIEGRKYSKITRSQVLSDLEKIFSSQLGTLAEFGESGFGRTILDLFAGNADLNAAWIEESFKDSFLETATSPQAIFAGARSLGYSVRRPTPAKAGLGISLKRTGVYPNVKVSIPRGTEFSYSGKTLTAIDDMEFTYDRNNPNFENGIMTLVSGRAVLAEGTVKTFQFFSDGNQNQEFILPDSTFSDWFGYNDPNYVEPEQMRDRSGRFTVVTSDASLIDNPEVVEGSEDKVFWRISRRGFHDPAINISSINDIEDFTKNSTSNRTVNYTVLVTSANDGRVKIEFSDGIISAIPFGAIAIQYFSTNGEQGNLLNVAGSELDTNSQQVLITQMNGSESDLTINDLNIALTTDIRNGLNIEGLESIKSNASQIYNSLDSLGNRNSYITFLKRISDVKYANAFGEDILNRIQNKRQGKFDLRYSNIVRFTILRDLYREKEGNFFVTDPFEYYVEGYKVNGLTYLWDYDYSNLPTQSNIVGLSPAIENIKSVLQKFLATAFIYDDESRNEYSPVNTSEFIERFINVPLGVEDKIPTVFTTNLTPKDFAVPGSELDNILDSLNLRGYLTLGSGQHQYVPPIVHELTMDIRAVLFEGSNFTDIKNSVINSIYSYLKDFSGFSTPIFRSKIESLVQKLPDVAGLNLYFKARTNEFTGLQINKLEWLGEETAQFITPQNLSMDGFQATLEFYYNGTASSITYDVTAESQAQIRNIIKDHYINSMTKPESNVPNENLKEDDVNEFTAKIWATAMNAVYSSLFLLFQEEKLKGNSSEADKIFNILEALRGWYFSAGKLKFKDTDAITNMVEGTDDTLANYKVYILEYVKLVRNILASVVAAKLIDSDGNVSNYSSQNEIVQFNISSENITVSKKTTNGKIANGQ